MRHKLIIGGYECIENFQKFRGAQASPYLAFISSVRLRLFVGLE